MRYEEIKTYQNLKFKRFTGVKKEIFQKMLEVLENCLREFGRQRILTEHVIGKLKKICRILSERYRNRRNRFELHFNLIAAIYNFELEIIDSLMQEVYYEKNNQVI